MKMLEVYQHVLNTCCYLVDEEGRVRKEVNDKTFPVTIEIEGESRVVVLPTRANLTSPEVARFAVFHPMQENLMRGESRILSFIRKDLNRRYGTSVAYLMNELVKISSGAINHSDLTSAQREIISRFGKTDAKFQETFFKIIVALGKSRTKNTPATLSLRKGFSIDGVAYSRVAIWSFPLADEVYKVIEETNRKKDYQPKIFGVSIRKGDLPILKNICEVFFPNSQDINKHGFHGVSDATDAPFFEAFVRSLVSLPKHTNHIAEVFYKGKHAVVAKAEAEENLEVSRLDIDWIKEPFTVADYRKEYLLIPLQDGNEGVAPVEKDKKIDLSPSGKQQKIEWGTVESPVTGNVAQPQVAQATVQNPTVGSQNQFLSNRQTAYQPVYQAPVSAPVSNNQFLSNRTTQAYQAPYQAPVNHSGWGFANPPQQPQTYQSVLSHHQPGLVYQPGMYASQPAQQTYQSVFNPYQQNNANRFFRR